MDTIANEYVTVEQAFENFIHHLTDIQTAVALSFDNFKERRKNTELKLQQYNSAANGSKKISLDIGGTIFNTTQDTLLREKDTFFSAMLESGQWQPDPETGRYFIDRSPHMFGVILDYLRDGKVWLSDKFSAGEHEMLRAELDFYQISFRQWEAPVWVSDNVKGDPGTVAFSDHNHLLTISAVSTAKRTVCALLKPHNGTLRFTLKVTSTKNGVGIPGMYLGEWGLGLCSGNVTLDNGKSWAEGEFPEIKFQKKDTVVEYKFWSDGNLLELTIVTQSLQLKKTFSYSCLPTTLVLNNSRTSSATFELCCPPF
eukprot:TRINITY_DN67802_c6_g1_i1.p1 TRINITY_DN67802_c6_g1~~TRINITY_DN67802_c6_g1_i1.p1  ORF type:complete len:320 (+),score=32.16 TRINITY_DN67802_c6_g1_i1:27-962(+)